MVPLTKWKEINNITHIRVTEIIEEEQFVEEVEMMII
jgi:hypothetical protein